MNVTIIANGDISNADDFSSSRGMIIAADGGARHCLRAGLQPDLIIGDFDSLKEDERIKLENSGAKMVRYSADKDETDLELALNFALNMGAETITLYGLLGGRWDMTFSNLMLLASPKFAGINFKVVNENTEMFILRGGNSLDLMGEIGEIVSAVPLSDSVQGINYEGLKWSLKNETLIFGSPRGVSNEFAASQAKISIESGILLIITTHHPKEFHKSFNKE